jgi:uncharacterized protein (TIGR02117 family)
LRIVRRIGAALLALVLAYAGAAVIGALVPANPGWVQARHGVRIYVADNGIHTDLVLPAADFADLLRPEVLGDPRYGAHRFAMFGWGDRDFYLNTPSWAEVNPLRVTKAMAGLGATVVHVHHVAEPRIGPDVRPLVLTPDEYRRVVAYVRATFGAGAPVRGYGGSDAFYPANGGYSAVRTCNEWTAQGLRRAGVRMAAWAPLPWGVMRWL